MYDQIENLAKKFQIIGNVEIDNGFSCARTEGAEASRHGGTQYFV